MRRRWCDVVAWVEWRAGLRRKPPAVLDVPELPPPRLPDPPTGLDERSWRDGLEVAACFSARVARRLDPDDYLPEMAPRARELCEWYAAGVRGALIGEDEPL